jgi:hypothetical protein
MSLAIMNACCLRVMRSSGSSTGSSITAVNISSGTSNWFCAPRRSRPRVSGHSSRLGLDELVANSTACLGCGRPDSQPAAQWKLTTHS